MCRPVVCKKCNKTTWAGCGMHVDQVMANVPKDLQCTCSRESGGGFLGKLLGR
ncbi:hypothetical protein [Propioniferax innocua]|uniref:hypothetical protein n=1 Tax=Propioniferax innocua TaxID=1753 RepID=UPI0031E485A3